MINFDRRYALFIALGIKTTTIRDKKKADQGEEIIISVDEEPFAEARVENVEEISLNAITKDMAEKDGFSSVKELKKVLRRYYPHLTEDSKVYVIHFKINRILNHEIILDEIMTISDLCFKFSKKSNNKTKRLLIELLKQARKDEKISFLRKNEKELFSILRDCYLELKE